MRPTSSLFKNRPGSSKIAMHRRHRPLNAPARQMFFHEAVRRGLRRLVLDVVILSRRTRQGHFKAPLLAATPLNCFQSYNKNQIVRGGQSLCTRGVPFAVGWARLFSAALPAWPSQPTICISLAYFGRSAAYTTARPPRSIKLPSGSLNHRCRATRARAIAPRGCAEFLFLTA
jgi:hypothetical protein